MRTVLLIKEFKEGGFEFLTGGNTLSETKRLSVTIKVKKFFHKT